MDELIERWRAGSRDGPVGELARELFVGRVRRIAAEAETADAAAREILAAIDEGFDPDSDEDLPGWALVEVDPESGPTGRDLPGLL